MKIYPESKREEEQYEPDLTKVQEITRIVALILALGSVSFFFLKIVFL